MRFSMGASQEETYVTMFRTGLEYRKAFNALLSSNVSGVSNATGMIACHSVECFLKSYLMKVNPSGNIRSIGHNLRKALNRSKSHGFTIEPESEVVINRLNSTFSRMLSRYPRNNSGNIYPDSERVVITLNELTTEIGTIVNMNKDGNFTE